MVTKHAKVKTVLHHWLAFFGSVLLQDGGGGRTDAARLRNSFIFRAVVHWPVRLASEEIRGGAVGNRISRLKSLRAHLLESSQQSEWMTNTTPPSSHTHTYTLLHTTTSGFPKSLLLNGKSTGSYGSLLFYYYCSVEVRQVISEISLYMYTDIGRIIVTFWCILCCFQSSRKDNVSAGRSTCQLSTFLWPTGALTFVCVIGFQQWLGYDVEVEVVESQARFPSQWPLFKTMFQHL